LDTDIKMLKKYNGSSFVSAPVKVRRASSWEFADVKARVGSNWEWKNPIKYDQDLINGLVSYYSMEETSGSTMYDKVGANNGTISGATINQTGKVGKCYSFDGVNDRVQTSSSHGVTTSRSYNGWFRLNALPSSGGWMFIYTDNKSESGLAVRNVSGNYEFVAYHTNSGNSATLAVKQLTISTGTWYNISYTWNGSKVMLYVNGSFESENTSATSTKTNGSDISRLGSWIGDNHWMNGLIDEVGIWNRALSATEVTKLYNYSKARYFE